MSEFDGKYKFGAILEVLKDMVNEKNRGCDGKSSETKETKSYLVDCAGKNDEKYEQIMNEDGKSSETKSDIDKKLQGIKVKIGEIGEGIKKIEVPRLNFLKEVDFSHYKETFDKILKEWKREIEEEGNKMNIKEEKNAQSTDISSEKIGDLVQNSGEKSDIFCKEKLDEWICGGNIDDFLEKIERVKRENEGDFNDILDGLKQYSTRKSGSGKDFNACENDNLSHPKHYQSSNGVECIDAIESATEDLTGLEAVCTANVLKYIWRWKRKNGLEDLKKARWYLDKLIKKLE